MWILLLTIWSVTLLDGTIEKVEPPITVVIKEFKNFADCEKQRLVGQDNMIEVYPSEEYGKAHLLECKLVRRMQ